MSSAIPRIISVDDHVVEPPDLWTSRISATYGDCVPHVVRERFDGGPGRTAASANDGWADV